MLRTRIITASILGIAFLLALFLLPLPEWIFATLIVTLLALWEWSRIGKFTLTQTMVFLGVSAIAGGVLFYVLSDALPSDTQFIFLISSIVATLFWILIVPLWLKSGWHPQNRLLLAVMGWLVMFPTWIALIDHRSTSPWLLLALMALVWVCDIAAYFTGKAWGRHKLAPSISPGKTWEGVWGAFTGVMIYALICFAVLRHFNPDDSFGSLSIIVILLAALGLAVISIVGDLFESWMKRGAGLKDSSNLLPGHGGVLDRIDALTSSLPIASLVIYLLSKGSSL